MWYQHRRVSSNFVGLFIQIRSVDTGHLPLSSSPRTTSEREDEMQRVAGGEVVLGGRLVVGPAVGARGVSTATLFSSIGGVVLTFACRHG